MGFSRFEKITIGTKRATIVGGKRTGAVVNLSDIKATPLDPADPKIRALPHLDIPQTLLQTFIDGSHDIVNGDVLTNAAGDEYPILSVAPWEWRGSEYMHLIIGDLKT